MLNDHASADPLFKRIAIFKLDLFLVVDQL